MDQDIEIDFVGEEEEILQLLDDDHLRALLAALGFNPNAIIQAIPPIGNPNILNNNVLPPPQPDPNPNPQDQAQDEENPIIEPGTPDYVITTPQKATVTLNFVKNCVSLNGSTRKWALTNLSTIIGDHNRVRVITTASMPVEVIPGPPGFSILPPQLDPGTKYVILRGVQNRWRIIQE